MTTLVARPERVRTASQRYQLTAVAHYRLMLLLLLFFAATVLVGTRLLWLGVLTDGGQGRHGPAGLVPVRADILDRNGVPLARTMHAYSIRSEEHTSELQSLMRTSYAVFCLKHQKSIEASTHY